MNLFTMNDAVLAIDGASYETKVDQVRVDVSTSTGQWSGIGGNVVPYATETTCTLNLNFPQDWTSEDSLSQYLYANHGELKTVTVTPQTGGASFTMEARMIAGSIGGAANALASASVSMPCSFPAKVTG